MFQANELSALSTAEQWLHKVFNEIITPTLFLIGLLRSHRVL
jgi:hypothetical protein